jgi:Bacterial membrane protein YfhO
MMLSKLRQTPGLPAFGVFTLLAGLVCLFFWKILFFPEKFHIPYDLHDFHYSLAHEIFAALQQRDFPLWDPYVYAGMPLAGNIQAQLFYLPTLAVLKLSDWIYGAFPYPMLEYQVMAHYLLAALGAYLLARSFDLSRPSALMSAVVYAFGGFFASQTQHLGLINGAAWIPWLFCCVKRFFESERWLFVVLAGGCLAMIIFAGFPALMVASCLYLGILGLILFVIRLRNCGWRRGAPMLVGLVTICVLAAGLSAVELLPAMELSRLSVAAEEHATVGLGGIPQEGLLTLFLPRAFGLDTSQYWGTEGLWLAYLYLGIAPLLLAAISLLVVRRGEFLLVFALTAFSLLWFLGENFSLSGWIWLLVPASLRGAIYAFCGKLFFDLGVALLAGFGLEAVSQSLAKPEERARLKTFLKILAGSTAAVFLLSLVVHAQAAHFEYGRPERGRLITISQALNVLVVLLLLCGTALYWRWFGGMKGSAVAWTLLLITVVDLFSFGSGATFNAMPGHWSDYILVPKQLGSRVQPVSFLKSDPDYRAGAHMRIDSRTASRVWCTAARLWQLESANGDDPLLLRDYLNYRLRHSGIDGSRRFVLNEAAGRWLDLLSVKYIVTSEDIPGFKPPQGFRLVEHGLHQVYLNPGFLPRAFLVSRIVTEDDREAVLQRLASPDFSPSNSVVIERTELPKLGNSIPRETNHSGSARIVLYSPDEITLSVEGLVESVLVLSEAFYPGWKAYVDGRPEEIARVNAIFRGIKMPAGKHHVLFRYEPHSVYLGAWSSGITLAAVGGAAGFSRRRKRGPRSGS